MRFILHPLVLKALAVLSLLGCLALDYPIAFGAKIVANDGAAGDQFGYSVAISGDTVLVGSMRNTEMETRSGSAYIFVNNGTRWVHMAKLVPKDGEPDDYFGASVSISDGTALVGALRDDDKGDGSGSAYVFSRNGTEWIQAAKLLANDGRAGDEFSASVAIGGDTAVVGAPLKSTKSGAAYVFIRNVTEWTQMAKLVASDGAYHDYFGRSVAIYGDTVFVGAHGHVHNGIRSGAVYVFVRNGTQWLETSKIVPHDGAQDDGFGYSVAISGDTAVVGAISDDDLGSRSGSAYVITRNGTGWSQVAKLVPIDGAAEDKFGISVAISGDTALIGALGDDDKGNDSGSAYVFARHGDEWPQTAKIVPNYGEPKDLFGRSVAVSGGALIVGAEGGDGIGDDSGAAYIYDTLSLSIQKYSDILTKFGFNNATLTANSASSFQFQFINSIPGSTIHAAIVAASFCNATNSAFQIKEATSVGIIGSVITNAIIATITRDIETDIDLADKNSGTVELNYCLRADLYNDSEPSFSVAARKVNLQLDITYDKESEFSITSIQTSEFEASDNSATATRSVDIKVFKDSCTSGCQIVDGDSNECFTSEANKAEVGDILTLCLEAEDTDIRLNGIESATVKAGETFTSDIVAFEASGTKGSDNFVTTTSVANDKVTLETLLLPAYYDALDGGSNGYLEVSGTVLVEYTESSVRRLGLLHLDVDHGYRRQLQDVNQGEYDRELQNGIQSQDEKSPFSINIPLENPDRVPKIAQDDNKNSSTGVHIGANIFFRFAGIVTMTGGAAAFFFG